MTEKEIEYVSDIQTDEVCECGNILTVADGEFCGECN